jgi:hypothetical protein
VVIGNMMDRRNPAEHGWQDIMRLTGGGFQATGKIWVLQNQIEYGYQGTTALVEDGYQGTGDNHKKDRYCGGRRSSESVVIRLLCPKKFFDRRLK